MMKEDIISCHDLVPSDNHLFGPMRKALRRNHYAYDEEVKTAVIKWLKEQSKEFYEAGKLRTRDVIKPMTSFFFMYDTCPCVGNYICTKENSNTFWLTLVYIYIYIYIIYIYIYIYISNFISDYSFSALEFGNK